jgi:hypothetical protein
VPAPHSSPRPFKCAFISAEGWGTFDQKTSDASQVNLLHPSYGRVRLRTLELAFQAEGNPRQATASLNGQALALHSSFSGKAVRLDASPEIELKAGDILRVEIAL